MHHQARNHVNLAVVLFTLVAVALCRSIPE